MRRIVFVLQRSTTLRDLAPLIHRTKVAGFQVEGWFDSAISKNDSKGYQAVDEEFLKNLIWSGCQLHFFHGAVGLASDYEREDVDLYVSIIPPGNMFAYDPTRSKAKWLTIQTGVDTFQAFKQRESASSSHLSLYTPWWETFGDRVYEVKSRLDPELEMKWRPAGISFDGYLPLEQVEKLDVDEIRQKWGIPLHVPVVVYLPIYGAYQSFWAKNIFSEQNTMRALRVCLKEKNFGYWQDVLFRRNDYQIYQSLLKFCRKNGCFLLVKSRKKIPFPDFMKETANLCLYDENFDPPTLIEALSVASLCVHYYSQSVREIVGMGVPGICVDYNYSRANDHLVSSSIVNFLLENRHDSFFSYEGVQWALSVREMIESFPQKTLEDYQLNLTKQRAFIQKYLRASDEIKPSESLLSHIRRITF